MDHREEPFIVDPGNILRLIKQSLFSEQEVFLRELLTNALDALEKVDKTIRYDPSFQTDDADLRVSIALDAVHKTVTITDNGIGMAEDEVIRYINQIAVSGALEFVKQYKDGAQRLNGKFGLGFYSSFMVSKLVEIDTWSWKPGAGGCHWSCDGGPITRIGETSRRVRGTSVICHLDNNALEFLRPERIDGIVRRFLDFSPFPIFHDGRQLNLVTAPWHFSPVERDRMGREKYRQLYERLNPGENQPIGWFHAETDGQFEARALLYLPDRHARQPGKLRVFADRTFICDDYPELLPTWLGFLDGVVDSPQLPLNLARDRLLENRQVIVLRSFLTKKTLDFLTDLLGNRYADYGGFWQRHGTHLKQGYLQSFSEGNNDLTEKIEKLLLFPSSRRPFTTLEGYFDHTPVAEKRGLFYLTDERGQATHLELLRNRNREVLWFVEPADGFIAEVIKQRHPDWLLRRVDEVDKSQGPDNENTWQAESTTSEPSHEWEPLKEVFRIAAGSMVARISVESMASKDIPGVLRVDSTGVVQDVIQQFTGKQTNGESHHVLVLNSNCPLVQSLGCLGEQLREMELPTAIVEQIWDNIRLQGGLMPQDQLNEASRRHAGFLTLVANKLGSDKQSTVKT